jgi:hypothetical protein
MKNLIMLLNRVLDGLQSSQQGRRSPSPCSPRAALRHLPQLAFLGDRAAGGWAGSAEARGRSRRGAGA